MESLFLAAKKIRNQSSTGFTLIEILIVIAIIGILVSIGLASYSQAQIKSRDARRRGDVKAMQNAWEQYYSNSTTASYPTSCSFATLSTYMPGVLPVDPQTNQSYCADANLSLTTYRFCALMESPSAANADSAGNYAAATKTHFCVSQLQ